MTRPTKLEIDCTTGVQSIIELTDEEIAEREAQAIKIEADRLAAEEVATAKAAAKASAQAKLATLGLTADEVAALLG
jgi:hypothetical protein